MRSLNGALTLAALVVVELADPEAPVLEAVVPEVMEPEIAVPEPLTGVPVDSNTGAMPEAGTVVVTEPEDKIRDCGINRVE